MSSLFTKYGIPQQSKVIEVEESPDKVGKKAMTKKTKALESPKFTSKSEKPRTETPIQGTHPRVPRKAKEQLQN